MTGPVDLDRRMVTGDGQTVVAESEADASWLIVEHNAWPADEALFAWDRVLTLAGSRTIDDRVYLPGSLL